MVFGSAGAQLITIAASPIIARLYRPSEFGVFAAFMSVASIVGIFSSLRTERKIFSEADEDSLELFYCGAIATSAIVSFVSTLVVLVLIQIEAIKMPGCLILFVFAFSFFYGVNQSSFVLGSKLNQYKLLIESSFIRSLSVVILQVCLFYILPAEFGIIIGALSGLILSSFYLVLKLKQHISSMCLIKAAKTVYRYKNYITDAKYGGGQALISSLSNNSPIIIISTFGNMAQAGYYLMAERLVRLPVNIISNNLRNVIAAKIGAYGNNKDVFLVKLSVFLFLVGLSISVTAWLLLDWVLVFFLGKQWLISSQVAKIMFLWVTAIFMTLPFQTYNLNYGVMKNVTKLELYFGLAKILLLIIVYKFECGLLTAATVISTISIAQCLAHVFIYWFSDDRKRLRN